ncbi:hypothetical protein HFD88_008983 [Aspergillus terreus]|nr:hypothetical protein HFD88_008983 [Aspergillus terreus]
MAHQYRQLKVKWPAAGITVTHLAIKYGPVTEHHPAAPCGNVIPEDIEKLRSVGDRIWKGQLEKKQPFEVVLWDASQPKPDDASLPLRLQRTGVTEEVKELVKEIHDKTNESWSGISDDIRSIHSGQAPDHPGSKNSYFAAMLFSNSEIRAMGYYVFDNILKVAANRPEFTLKHLIALYRDFVPATAEFLGYVGHTFLRESHRKIDFLITQNVENNPRLEEAREDFLAMVSVFAQYINLLNAQNLHMFPWQHTPEYPIRPA